MPSNKPDYTSLWLSEQSQMWSVAPPVGGGLLTVDLRLGF